MITYQVPGVTVVNGGLKETIAKLNSDGMASENPEMDAAEPRGLERIPELPKLPPVITGRFGGFMEKLEEADYQKKLVLVTVCIALLLDNMLYMVIVPIIPIYLEQKGEWEHTPTELVKTTLPPTTTNVYAYMNTTLYQNATMKPLPKVIYNRAGEDVRVGVLFASKAIVQLLINPFSGYVIDRIGYDRPMMIGLTIMFLSTTCFAFGPSYWYLFFARSLQGVGSAFADTSGLAMIADRFPVENGARNKALGIALAFISFGCLVAPPFGGFMYTIGGKELPFLILAALCLIDGFLLLLVMHPVRKERKVKEEHGELEKGTPIWRLMLDPYVAVCAGALAMSNVSLAFLEPTIAIWMKSTLGSSEWEIGFVWLPAFLPHVAGVYLTVILAKSHPKQQWLLAFVGLAMEGLACLIVPFTRHFLVLIIPICLICFGIALVDTAILPTLAYIVDIRHTSVYGSIYAIADISYSFAYSFGPIIAGNVFASIGFYWLNIGICISNVVYCPLIIYLKTIYKYKPMDVQLKQDDMEDEEGGMMDETEYIQKNGSMQDNNYQTYSNRVSDPRSTGSEKTPLRAQAHDGRIITIERNETDAQVERRQIRPRAMSSESDDE